MLRNEHKDVKVPFGASNYSELVYSFLKSQKLGILIFSYFVSVWVCYQAAPYYFPANGNDLDNSSHEHFKSVILVSYLEA